MSLIDAREKFAARVAQRTKGMKAAEAHQEWLYGPRWEDYTRRRNEWISDHPDAEFHEYQLAMHALAAELGL